MMEVVQAKWHQGGAARRRWDVPLQLSQVCIVQTDGTLCKLLLPPPHTPNSERSAAPT